MRTDSWIRCALLGSIVACASAPPPPTVTEEPADYTVRELAPPGQKKISVTVSPADARILDLLVEEQPSSAADACSYWQQATIKFDESGRPTILRFAVDARDAWCRARDTAVAAAQAASATPTVPPESPTSRASAPASAEAASVAKPSADGAQPPVQSAPVPATGTVPAASGLSGTAVAYISGVTEISGMFNDPRDARRCRFFDEDIGLLGFRVLVVAADDTRSGVVLYPEGSKYYDELFARQRPKAQCWVSKRDLLTEEQFRRLTPAQPPRANRSAESRAPKKQRTATKEHAIPTAAAPAELRQKCTEKGANAAASCYDKCGPPLTPAGEACRRKCWDGTYRPIAKRCGYDPGAWIPLK